MVRRLSLLILIFSCLCLHAAALERIGLKAAMEKGMVSVVAGSTGQSYNQRGLRLKVKNGTGKPLQLMLDPALVFRPADTGYQDLVIVGDQVLALAANGESSLELQSFCAKSYAAAPRAALSYSFLRQGDSAMIRVIGFIKKYNLYNSLGQNAVWVLTNDHSLEGVFDPEQAELSKKLLALLVQLTGKPVPDYFKLYKMNTTAGEPAFEPRVLRLYAAFDWNLEAPKVLSLGIYNDLGKLIQPVMEAKELARGGYKMTVTFEAENVHPGTYFIRLKDGELVMKEQAVKVD